MAKVENYHRPTQLLFVAEFYDEVLVAAVVVRGGRGVAGAD